MLICKVKFQEVFKDGNISPLTFKAGSVHELPENIVNRIIQSGGTVDILEKKVPPSTVEKKAKKDEA